MKEDGLTELQREFCHQYTVDYNGRQAAIRAGYSEKGADVQASNLLGMIKVQNYLKTLQCKLQNKTEITAERVLKEFSRIAFFDVRKLYDDNGQLKQLSELDEDIARAISGIEVNEIFIEHQHVGNTKKIKLSNKIAALESLAKHLGLFQLDNESKRPTIALGGLSTKDLEALEIIAKKLSDGQNGPGDTKPG